MNLHHLLQNGIMGVAKTAGRFYLTCPQGRAFLRGLVPALDRAATRRARHEKKGLHIPPMLIAGISAQCNLRCAGCYARANGGCGDEAGQGDLPADAWRSIFAEAEELGISLILLAGGEPLARRDVLEVAKDFPHMLFPVFTNGTLIDEETIALFDAHRHIIPVLSVEGGESATDARRGPGVYAAIRRAMGAMRERRVLFGASVTVTARNLDAVSSIPFVRDLRESGLGLLFFVEYVPVAPGEEHLALTPAQQEILREKAALLRRQFTDVIIVAFPGDEEEMGGCLASGRGFFHINARGGAEPCPFSPHAERNLATSSIRDVLASAYFAGLQRMAAQAGPHVGGCVLFARDDEVAALTAGV